MASRNLSHEKVMVGRVATITLSDASGEKLSIEGLKDGTISFSEEIKENITELEDGNEVVESFGRKYTFEITLSELDTTDMSDVDGCDEIVVATASGGANGTGRTLTMDNLDKCVAQIDGMKTKITAMKSIPEEDSPGFSVADNASA